MDNLSRCVVLFGLNHLNVINSSLDKKKKKILIDIALKNPKIRIQNFMVVISLYDDLDFKSHFRLTRSSVEVIQFNQVFII